MVFFLPFFLIYFYYLFYTVIETLQWEKNALSLAKEQESQRVALTDLFSVAWDTWGTLPSGPILEL